MIDTPQPVIVTPDLADLISDLEEEGKRLSSLWDRADKLGLFKSTSHLAMAIGAVSFARTGAARGE